MNRYLIVTFALLMILTAPALAQAPANTGVWNKSGATAESQNVWSMKNLLFWKNNDGTPKNITAKPGKTAQKSVSTEPKSTAELAARQQAERDTQAAGLEQMRLANLKRAEELIKRDAALFKQQQLAQQQEQQKQSAPLVSTGTAGTAPPAKTIYIRPGLERPAKVFSGTP